MEEEITAPLEGQAEAAEATDSAKTADTAEQVENTETTERPSWLPEKFKTPEDMAKSYAEMEKKMGGFNKLAEKANMLDKVLRDPKILSQHQVESAEPNIEDRIARLETYNQEQASEVKERQVLEKHPELQDQVLYDMVVKEMNTLTTDSMYMSSYPSEDNIIEDALIKAKEKHNAYVEHIKKQLKDESEKAKQEAGVSSQAGTGLRQEPKTLAESLESALEQHGATL